MSQLIRVKTRSSSSRDRCIDVYKHGLVLRYVATHINKDGYRTFAHSRQGRCTYETLEEVEKWIDAAMTQNSEHTLAQIYGLPLEPRACMCWPGHFDPVRIIDEQERRGL